MSHGSREVALGVTTHGEIPSCAAGVPFLRALPPEGLAELGRGMRHREYERGAALALAGDPIDHLIVVARGRIEVVRTSAHGREQVTRVLGPGDFLGELALFAPATHEGDVVAMEASAVCLLPRDAVQSLLARHPHVATSLVEALARRLAHAEAVIADLGLRDVEARLAAELLRSVPPTTDAVDGVRVRLAIPWAEVASRLGTTPESLSRRLKSLARRRLIRQERPRTVVLLDVPGLRSLAGR